MKHFSTIICLFDVAAHFYNVHIGKLVLIILTKATANDLRDYFINLSFTKLIFLTITVNYTFQQQNNILGSWPIQTKCVVFLVHHKIDCGTKNTSTIKVNNGLSWFDKNLKSMYKKTHALCYPFKKILSLR